MKWAKNKSSWLDRLPSTPVDSRRFPSHAPQPAACRVRRGRRGFTLMELLVVMAIMLIISTILVASYFGMIRAASYTAAENDVYNTLQLARQRACMDGSRVFFMLIDSNSYVLVHGVGTLSQDAYTTGDDSEIPGPDDKLSDAYADLEGLTSVSNNVRIWHMDENAFADVLRIRRAYDQKIEDPLDTSKEYKRNEYSIFVAPLGASSDLWRKGDRYGFELYPRQALPKGFFFSLSGSEFAEGKFPGNDKLIFHPDGRSSRGDGGQLSATDTGITTLYIYEKIVADKQHTVIIHINHSDGTITVEEV